MRTLHILIVLTAAFLWPVPLACAQADEGSSVVEAAAPNSSGLLGGAWLEWPFESGVGQIYQTYGQSERDCPLQVHQGLDIAAPAGTPVYSPLAGEVSVNFGEDYADHQQGVAIRGFWGGKEVFIKLLHLERESIQVLLGDQVEAGDFLGFVRQWDDDKYASHLHVEIGGAILYVLMTGGDAGQANLAGADYFWPTKNPLAWLLRPQDEIQPRLLPLTPENPILFKTFRDSADSHEDPCAATDPSELKGLNAMALAGKIDIEFGVSDSYSAADSIALMPCRVRIYITSAEDASRVVLDRYLNLDGKIQVSSEYDERIYLAPPAHWPRHSGFRLRLLSLNRTSGVVPDPAAPAEDEKPKPWDTSECGPGHYVVYIEASDMHHKNVLLQKFPCQVVASRDD